MYEIYGGFGGVCTLDFKNEVIKYWAEVEFEGDFKEAKSQINFHKAEINKLK